MALVGDGHRLGLEKQITSLSTLPVEILTQILHYLPHSKWVDKLAQTYNRQLYGACLSTLVVRRQIPAPQRAIYDAFELSWFGFNPWNYDSGELDHLAVDSGDVWPQVRRFDFSFLNSTGTSDLQWLEQDVAAWRSCSPSQANNASFHTDSDSSSLAKLVDQATAVNCVVPQSFLNYYKQLNELYDESILEGHRHDPAFGDHLVKVHPAPGEIGYMFRFRVENGFPTYLYLDPGPNKGHAIIQSWQRHDVSTDGWDLSSSRASQDHVPLKPPVLRDSAAVTDLSQNRTIETYLQSKRSVIPSRELVRATDFEEWLAGQHYFSLYGIAAGVRLRLRMLADASILTKRVRAFQRLIGVR